MKNSVTKAAPLHGHYRRTERTTHPTVVGPRTSSLPTVDDLAGAPAPVLDALDQWARLREQHREHVRAEGTANAAAADAATAYKLAVADAIAKGADPAKVRDASPEHRATAAAHRDFARRADAALTRRGQHLGAVLDEHAAALVDVADQRLAEATETALAAVAHLDDVADAWAAAFGLRLWASRVAHEGGPVPAHHGGKAHRARLDDALAAVRDLLAEPDRLRADETTLTAWRTEQQNARAASTTHHQENR